MSVPKKMIWVIGDIHGMYDPLKQLINELIKREITYNETIEKIIFIGDYIDYGPSSKEVIDFIMSLEYPTVCLAGNHEDLLLHFFKQTDFIRNYGNMWFNGNGGQETILSFTTDKEVIKKVYADYERFSHYYGSKRHFEVTDFTFESKYMNFFKNLKYAHYEDITVYDKPFRFAFSHAGLNKDFDIEEQLQITDFEHFHKYVYDKKIFLENSNIWRREVNRFDKEKFILIYGHTPTTNFNPENKVFENYDIKSGFPFVTTKNKDTGVCYDEDENSVFFNCYIDDVSSIDIDTGSVYGKCLSAIGLNDLNIMDNMLPIIQVSTSSNHRSRDFDISRLLFKFVPGYYSNCKESKERKKNRTNDA